MKSVKLNAESFWGSAVTVSVKGDIDAYKDAFLSIFNTVRENYELISVKNYSSNNNITVYCINDVVDELIDYLCNFGEIESCEKVRMYRVEELPDYNSNYSADYTGDFYEQMVVPYFE